MIKKGTLAAFSAYLLWGLFPIYWRMLQSVPPIEILAHRISWSLLVLGVLLSLRQQWSTLREALKKPKIWLTYIASGTLLAVNWLVYIWAVNSGYVVDTSLGYFINPLVNVMLGVLILGERLRRGQFWAVVIATLGVLYLALSFGVKLWIALTLAFSFGFYALLRKTAPLNSLQGLSLEMAWLILPAFAYLIYLESTSAGFFGGENLSITLLFTTTGIATAIPLLLFGYGAQRVTLITLGILQYIAPSLQFLIGVFLYGEAFTTTRMIGFGMIWTALAIYTADGVMSAREQRLALTP